MEKFNIRSSFKQLNQDEKSDIQLSPLINGETSVFVAELNAGKKLPAHYHNQGAEIYHILSGEGKLELGRMSEDDVIWEECLRVNAEDVFEIKSKVVHRLSNDGNDKLQIIFITPPSHLNEDRFFI